MSKKKQCIFLSLVISTIFCFQVVASSDTYRDEKGILHSVITAKDGTEYDNTSTLISSHEEYTDKNGDVIKVIDYVNPEYAENVNVKKIIAEKSNYENNEAILYNFYDDYNVYKSARNRSNKTETKKISKIQILHSEFNTQIKNINDVEDMAHMILLALFLDVIV